jgi:serine/threonine protein kinase
LSSGYAEHKICTSEAIEMGLKIIREVEEETKTVVVNCEQCKRLSLVYHKIGLFIKDVKKTILCSESKTFGSLFSEIMRVMRKGRYLILAYATHDWYKSVVSWGVNWEAFEDVHIELQRCIECFHLTVPELEKISPHFQALVYRTWTEDLKSDAKLDHDHILAKLSREQIRLDYSTNETRKEQSYFDHLDIWRDQRLRLLQVATEKVKESEEQLTANEGDEDEKLPTYLRIHSSDITVGKQIGNGGYGEVHEAIWLNCMFAVKLIKTDDVNTLRREVGILSRLRHPHIIQLVGFSVSQTMSMIVMEKMDGDLHHVIEDCSRKPPFALPKAVDILSQIAAGMAYLHDQGVFHGDLKASNVLVSRKGHLDDIEVKISDFGMSQHVKLKRRLETSKDLVETISSLENTTSREHSDVYSGSSFSGTVGTTCWRAPEVFPLQLQKTNDHNRQSNDIQPLFKFDSVDSDVPEDLEELYHTAISNPTFLSEAHNKDAMEDPVKKEPSYTAKADVYSYAMTCYEVLTGLSPFADYVRSILYEKLIAGTRPELPMNLPPSLSSLIKACWDIDPGQRPTFTTICEELRNMQQFIRVPSALSLLHDSEKFMHNQLRYAGLYWTLPTPHKLLAVRMGL